MRLTVSVWLFTWHGGIPLHGEGTPPQGISRIWVMTWPDDERLQELLAEERLKKQALGSAARDGI